MGTKKTAIKHRNRRILFLAQKGRCLYCGCLMTLDPLDDKPYATLDHVKPKSLGGTSRLDNLCLCCQPCNLAKGNGYGVIVVDDDRFGF